MIGPEWLGWIGQVASQQIVSEGDCVGAAIHVVRVVVIGVMRVVDRFDTPRVGDHRLVRRVGRVNSEVHDR